jgi:crotonobetainyl-CoA:carnitine CoA-transferase CaiB-like acyl-CoA transferase
VPINNRTSLGSSLNELVLLEIGDELGDYAAMLLAGFGVDVIKLEPREGSPSRRIGPFAAPPPSSSPVSNNGGGDRQSIFFWRYNLNKKSAVLDVDHSAARPLLARMAAKADLVLLSGEVETVEQRLESWRELAQQNPSLIVCTITPFGL